MWSTEPWYSMGQQCQHPLRAERNGESWALPYTLHFLLLLSFCLSRTAPSAYGGSQAKGRIGAPAAGLHHSHSSVGSELRLPPTPQLTATPDAQPIE